MVCGAVELYSIILRGHCNIQSNLIDLNGVSAELNITVMELGFNYCRPAELEHYLQYVHVPSNWKTTVH